MHICFELKRWIYSSYLNFTTLSPSKRFSHLYHSRIFVLGNIQKPNWTASWATCCRWPCSEQESWTRQYSVILFTLNPSVIQWLNLLKTYKQTPDCVLHVLFLFPNKIHIFDFPWQHSDSKENSFVSNSILLPQHRQIPLWHKKLKDAPDVNYGIKQIYVQGSFL